MTCCSTEAPGEFFLNLLTMRGLILATDAVNGKAGRQGGLCRPHLSSLQKKGDLDSRCCAAGRVHAARHGLAKQRSINAEGQLHSCIVYRCL